jgi:uncharacterized membrane protein
MILNAVIGVITGFVGHQMEQPTKEIFSVSKDIVTLASYAEGGVLVLIAFTVAQLRRKASENKMGRADLPHYEHAIADLGLAFMWVGMGTVLGYMLDAWLGNRK